MVSRCCMGLGHVLFLDILDVNTPIYIYIYIHTCLLFMILLWFAYHLVLCFMCYANVDPMHG